MSYAFSHQGQAFTPDGRLPAETDADARNRETEAREIEWLKTAPERVFLYVKKYGGSLYGWGVRTWLGTDIATEVLVGEAYKVPAFGRPSTRRSVSCRIFGVRYVGTYYESSGDYCRLRKARG